MIPVFDMAKASPRIPLPIMALLRLKTDMPNEVFPSNCSRSTREDVTLRNQSGTRTRANNEIRLTSVKWISFLTPALFRRLSSCSANSSNLPQIIKPLLSLQVHICNNCCSFVGLTRPPCCVHCVHSSSQAPSQWPNHQS